MSRRLLSSEPDSRDRACPGIKTSKEHLGLVPMRGVDEPVHRCVQHCRHYLNDGGCCHKLVSIAAAWGLVLYQMLGEAIVNVPSGKLFLREVLEEGLATATQK